MLGEVQRESMPGQGRRQENECERFPCVAVAPLNQKWRTGALRRDAITEKLRPVESLGKTGSRRATRHDAGVCET